MLLSELVQQAQNSSEHAMLAILSQFKPILLKYANYLHDIDDAYEELQTLLISLVKNTDWSKLKIKDDGSYVKFFTISIWHYYIVLSKRIVEKREYTSCSESEVFYIHSILSDKDEYTALLSRDLQSILTPKEYYVVYWTCMQGLSSTYLADMLHKSRQDINQTKKRALKKLQTHFHFE